MGLKVCKLTFPLTELSLRYLKSIFKSLFTVLLEALLQAGKLLIFNGFASDRDAIDAHLLSDSFLARRRPTRYSNYQLNYRYQRHFKINQSYFILISLTIGLIAQLDLNQFSKSLNSPFGSLPQSIGISNCYAEEPPFILPKMQQIHKLKSALVKTDRGDLWFELFPEIAPWHVANLKYLADIGFYREIPFKHYFEGYIIQTDTPNNTGLKFKYSVPPEFSDKVHDIGTLGMARSPDGANPDRRSDATRFHIILGRSPNLDGSYTVFGQLINGFAVLKKLRPGDRIKEIKVFVREE